MTANEWALPLHRATFSKCSRNIAARGIARAEPSCHRCDRYAEDYAIERIARVFESIDDSDGHLGSLLVRASEIHLTAAGVAKPDRLRLQTISSSARSAMILVSSGCWRSERTSN
jgi:hypothetical protein